MIRAAATVLAVVALLACEHQVTAYPPQPPLVSSGAVHYAYTVVNWVESIDAIPQDHCPHRETWYACAKPVIAGDTGHCTVWALRPKDFNDQVRLAILGHEFWHCLGARHG